MSASHETNANAPTVGAVVVAAGESRRMKGADKIFHPLNGLPLVWHSISVLRAHPLIGKIVLVTSSRNFAKAQTLVAEQNASSVVTVCEGGGRRQDSALLGLQRLYGADLVIIHDGARPFISAGLLDAAISAARKSGAAVAAVPVKDTIKQSEDGTTISRTMPRDTLWAVQTPQIFSTSLIMEAHRRISNTVTDDASMVEAIGHPVSLFPGSYYNIKVTTPEDLTFAQAICNLRNEKKSGVAR